MIRKIVLVLVGIMILAGVSLYWSQASRRASERRAEAARDLCYATRGYDVARSQRIPPEVSAECTQAFRAHEQGEAGRNLVAALIGLVCAAMGVILLSILLRVSAAARRRIYGP
jgi:hypothetical protein